MFCLSGFVWIFWIVKNRSFGETIFEPVFEIISEDNEIGGRNRVLSWELWLHEKPNKNYSEIEKKA